MLFNILGVILFCEVNVVVDMIFAEAVVAFAAGTIAEFELGVVGVGAAAYGALAGVSLALCFGVCLFCCFFEINNIGTALVSAPAEMLCENISAENKVIEYGYKRDKCEEYLTGHQA